jgi:hypothetical protein
MRRVVSANDRRTEFLARSLVNRLEDRGVVEFGDAEAAILFVTRTLGENFATVDALELEARKRFKGRRKPPTEDELIAEMRRIAAERNFIF